MGYVPGLRVVEAKYAGTIEAHGGCGGTGRLARPVEIGAARRSGPGAGDPRPAPGQALLTLEGQKAEEIAAVLGVHVSTVRNWRGYFVHGGGAGLRRRPRPGQQAKIGPHAGAIAAAILNEDVRHDGGGALPRPCAEIARRGGPAISPRWLSHQLRQRGLPGGGRATPSKGARMQQRGRPAVSTSPIRKPRRQQGRSIWCFSTNPRRLRIPIWRAAGPGAAPSCASKRPVRRKSGRCSAPLIRCTGACSCTPARPSAPPTLLGLVANSGGG